jgi:hypothetical protein
MNDNLSAELREALTEVHAVRIAIAADKLDRRSAHAQLLHISEIVERAANETTPLRRLVAAN